MSPASSPDRPASRSARRRSTSRRARADSEPGTLVTFTLNQLNLQVGTADFGLSITGGSLTIASLAPTTGDLARRWTSVKGTGLTATLAAGALFSATVESLGIAVNSSSAGAGAVNFTTLAGIDTPDGTTSVEGKLKDVNIFNVVSGGAKFSIVKENVDVRFNAGGTGIDLDNASLLRITLSELDLSVGAAGAGLHIGPGGALIIAILKPPAPAAGTDTRSWPPSRRRT